MGITHKWNGTVLTITSDSGSTAMDLKGEKGDTGARGVRGLPGERGGGAAIEDGIISTETTWSSAAIMDNFAEQMAVSGNPVECNPIPNYPLHIITDIEPKQSGSGEPYPAGGGKNLLPYPYVNTTLTTNGITFTDNGDGSITINGTATGTAFFNLSPIDIVAGNNFSTNTFYTINGEYTFSFTDSNVGIAVVYTGEAGKYPYLRIGSGTTINNLTVYPMLEKNSVVSEWVSYSNIRPISGMDAVNLYQSNDIETLHHINPIGETIYGGSLDWEKGLLYVKWACIEEYNGEEVLTEYISSTGGLHTGSQIVYRLLEPYTIPVDKTYINALTGENRFETDAANISVLGRVDTMYQLSQLAARVAALEAALSGVNE